MTSADLTLVLPEILLSVYAMAMLLVAVYTTKDGMASTLMACLSMTGLRALQR